VSQGGWNSPWNFPLRNTLAILVYLWIILHKHTVTSAFHGTFYVMLLPAISKQIFSNKKSFYSSFFVLFFNSIFLFILSNPAWWAEGKGITKQKNYCFSFVECFCCHVAFDRIFSRAKNTAAASCIKFFFTLHILSTSALVIENIKAQKTHKRR